MKRPTLRCDCVKTGYDAFPRKSYRIDAPFKVVRKNAIYEKGAFTGAIVRKPGRFELADKGTLFLELQNFIERAVILSPGSCLSAPLDELKQETAQTPLANLSTLEEMEREHVLRALRECNWVTGGPNGAAIRLGMKRTTLAYRIRKLGISCRPE